MVSWLSGKQWCPWGARQFKIFPKLDEGMARPEQIWRWYQTGGSWVYAGGEGHPLERPCQAGEMGCWEAAVWPGQTLSPAPGWEEPGSDAGWGPWAGEQLWSPSRQQSGP